MMGGAVAHWLVGEQCVGEKQREQIREECSMEKESFNPRTKPLSPSFTPHFCAPTNYLSALNSGSSSGPCWFFGWGHCVVFLSKKSIWEFLQLGISV